MTKICFLVTCYNRKEKTTHCIKSIIEQNPNLIPQFVLVDDGCTDGTSEAVEQIPNIDIHIIKSKGNLFYSGGMHVAIEYVKNNKIDCDYYALINDDVEFYAHSFERMVELPYKDSIRVGATDDGNGKMTYAGVKSCSKWRPSFKKVMSLKDIVYCDTFNANCVLIPAEVFKTLDNIDSHYVHGFGDFDYGLMARSKGINIIVTNFYVGKCLNNPVKGNWKDHSFSIRKRIKMKESPNGSPSKMWFYFTKKHFGIFSAIFTVVYQYVLFFLKKY